MSAAPLDPRFGALVPGIMRAAEGLSLGLQDWVDRAPVRVAERAVRESESKLASLRQRHPQVHELWGTYPGSIVTAPRGKLADQLRPIVFSAKGREVLAAVISTGTEARAYRVAIGERDHVRVDVRKLVALARLQRGETLTIAHNHERGGPQPSEEDLDLNADIAEQSAAAGIGVLDFLIVSPRRAWSFSTGREYRRGT